MALTPEYHNPSRVIVCTPWPEALERVRHDNWQKWLFRSPLDDPERFIDHHKQFTTTLSRYTEVINVQYLDLSDKTRKKAQKLPNLIFSRDAVINTPHGAIMASMATQQRRPEVEVMEEVMQLLGIPILFSVPKNVTVEGGDIICINPDVLWIGYGPRTSLSGLRYLAAMMINQLKQVKKIVGFKVAQSRINLDGVLMILDEKSILIDQDSVGREVVVIDFHGEKRATITEYFKSEGIREYPVKSEEGLMLATNIFHLGQQRLVAYDHNIRVNEMLNQLKFSVVSVIGERLVKGSGGPRCMTNPVRWSTGN